MTETSVSDGKIKTAKTRRPPKKITEIYLHNSGLYYLQRFAASSAHFRAVMMRKIDKSCRAHPEQDREECVRLLQKLVEKFEGLGLLNDAAYSRGMIESLRRRGLSERMIRAKLQSRGLTGQLVDDALDNHADEQDGDAELQAAIRFARRKRLGPFSRKGGDENRFEKELASLARAGFGYDIAKRVLETDPADPDLMQA